MARKFHRRESLTALSEINVTPLIDLAFALLIIFMITAPLLEQTIQVDLPDQQPLASATPPDVPYQPVAIDAEGKAFWGDQPVTDEMLDQLLEDLSAQEDPPVLRLRADGGLPYERVITVIDLIQRNGLTKLSLDTEVK